MTRAHFVEKARKDYPDHDIKKGESYWWWKFMVGGRGGPRRFSKTRPKPSQLTQSEFWQRIYELQERDAPDAESFADDVQGIINELEEIRDETQGKLDSLPDNLQNGQPGELQQGRIDAIEDALSTIESVESDLDEDELKLEIGEPTNSEMTTEEKEEWIADLLESLKSEKTAERWGEITEALSGISCE